MDEQFWVHRRVVYPNKTIKVFPVKINADSDSFCVYDDVVINPFADRVRLRISVNKQYPHTVFNAYFDDSFPRFNCRNHTNKFSAPRDEHVLHKREHIFGKIDVNYVVGVRFKRVCVYTTRRQRLYKLSRTVIHLRVCDNNSGRVFNDVRHYDKYSYIIYEPHTLHDRLVLV